YAMRARLALAQSGQCCELRELVLRDKPEALLAASPKGTVPVLVLPDRSVIEESLDIMLWALERADPEGWLPPPGALRDAVLASPAACAGAFNHGLARYKYPQRYDDPTPEAHRARCALWVLGLNARLPVTTFLFG